jgi:hypothetical protein
VFCFVAFAAVMLSGVLRCVVLALLGVSWPVWLGLCKVVLLCCSCCSCCQVFFGNVVVVVVV